MKANDLRDRLVERVAGGIITRRVAEAEARITAVADARVREALSAGLRPADERLRQEGFRRLTTDAKASTRDLEPMAQDLMLQIVAWLWESNPLAQWMVEFVVDFVWGEGGAIKSDVAEVQEILDRFWDDPVNQLDGRMDSFVRDLGLDGELCLPVSVNYMTGHVRVGYIAPENIDTICNDPTNALVPITVVLKGDTLAGGRKQYLKVIREDTTLGSYAGLVTGALPNESDPVSGRLYDGSCFLWQVNKRSGARRGRSDLLSLIDWLDGYDALLFDYMERAGLLGSFIWDVTLKGHDEKGLREWLANNGRVRKGAIRAHNENVEWKAVAPDLKSYEAEEMAKMLRNHMLGARSIPGHYYGDGGDANLATAKEMGLPTVKRMSRRQRVVRFSMRDMGRFAVDQAIVAGVIPKKVADELKKDPSRGVRAELPEISTRDTTAITTALTGLAVALAQAEDKGWLRRETAGRIFALMASQLGVEIDPDEEVTPQGQPPGPTMTDYERRPHPAAVEDDD
jgi:hypothetical protein